MSQRLRRANCAARIEQDRDVAVPARLVALIERRYDEFIAVALTFREGCWVWHGDRKSLI